MTDNKLASRTFHLATNTGNKISGFAKLSGVSHLNDKSFLDFFNEWGHEAGDEMIS